MHERFQVALQDDADSVAPSEPVTRSCQRKDLIQVGELGAKEPSRCRRAFQLNGTHYG